MINIMSGGNKLLNVIAVPQSRIWGICDTKEIIFDESKQENFTPKRKKLIFGPTDNSEFAKNTLKGEFHGM